jgi:hypothetical protein
MNESLHQTWVFSQEVVTARHYQFIHVLTVKELVKNAVNRIISNNGLDLLSLDFSKSSTHPLVALLNASNNVLNLIISTNLLIE